MPREYGALNHYVYPVLDVECNCAMCRTWRLERDSFDDLKRQTLSHNRSCMCWRCQKRRQHQQSFLAAAAKRELYSEMSYHAANHPSYGPQLMNWVSTEIENDVETDGWWATLAQAYPLSYWFGRFQSSVYPESEPASAVVTVAAASTSGTVQRRRLRWWCDWCGEDLPQGRIDYCSDMCSASASASGKPKLVRRRLSELVSTCVAAVSGTNSWSASGVAA